jgi:hypothetical protein
MIAFALMAIGTVVYLTAFVIIEDIPGSLALSRSFDDSIPTPRDKPL